MLVDLDELPRWQRLEMDLDVLALTPAIDLARLLPGLSRSNIRWLLNLG